VPPFDPGPPAAWAALFDQAPLEHHVDHPSGRFRAEFGPVFYRGRLDGTARLLIIGQDPSTDETLAQRVLVGAAGQRVQGLLGKLGITRSYLMLNVFLFGITGQFDATLRTISAADPVRSYRNTLFDRVLATNPIEAVLALGVGARRALELWPGGAGLASFRLVHPTARAGVTDQWNLVLPQLQAAVAPEHGLTADPTVYGPAFTPADGAPIPRHDLPFGLPAWHGTDGTHSSRERSRTKIVWSVDGVWS
jgi:hypothetical protein